jgi:hypothetical protein
LQLAAMCAALPVVAACDSATTASITAADAKATVFLAGDSTPATTTTVVANDLTWMQFTLDVSVTNAGAVPIRFEFCASTIEQRVGDMWTVAWSPICALPGAASPAEVQPGETFRQPVQINAALRGPGAPVWNGSVFPATIRFNAAFIPHSLSGAIPRVASNEVRLVLRR